MWHYIFSDNAILQLSYKSIGIIKMPYLKHKSTVYVRASNINIHKHLCVMNLTIKDDFIAKKWKQKPYIV